MKAQMQVTFRNMKPSKVVEDWILAEAAKLEGLYGSLMGCRVVVESPHRHHKKGSLYHIRIDLTVPGGEIVVKREPSLTARARHLGVGAVKKQGEVRIPHKHLQQAINDAFKAAGRRLQDYARRQRGDIKRPTALPEGRVSRVLRDKGYGFLTSDDGREIYFHKNSVLGGAFPKLTVGAAVRFVEEVGEEGPQASTVRIVPRRGIRPAAAVAAASAD
jgi:cold shock CspA family protein